MFNLRKRFYNGGLNTFYSFESYLLFKMKLKKTFLIASTLIFVMCFGGIFMVLSGFFLYLSPKLPSVESIRDIRLETPLRIYTIDGKLIGEFGERRRYPIKFENIPENFVNALIAAEDDDFYEHNGVSLKGLVRAAAQLILTGRKGSGGSTLTMQLTRHVFLSLQRTFSRKFNEILLALRIEKELSKEEILELYVNLMFLGKRAYGIEAAAEVYYGKTVSQLSLAQQAMLVGVFKGPSVLNPINNPEGAIARRNYVLGRMLKLDYISQEEYEIAVAEPVTAKYHGSKIEVQAPYVAEMARTEAIERFGKEAYTNGYTVITTVKGDLQERAQQAVTNGLLAYDSRHGFRGPEQQFSILNAPVIKPSEKAPATASEAEGELNTSAAEKENNIIRQERDLTKWLEDLEAIPSYGGLEPVVVTHIGEDFIEAATKEGNIISINWENGLSEARPYLTEDSRGPKPEKASDIVQLGDVIRAKQDDAKHWHFSQIPAAQSSLVSLNPKNGAIISLVGGFDFYHSNFNRATQAQRQPGSNFKPFIYTAALENGLTAATVMNDAPIVIDDKQLESTWRPENSSKKFYGPTRLRTALAKSRNLVSIRVLERIGVSAAIDTFEKFGFDSEELPRDLSLALGTHAVTPLEVVAGYAIFANGGFRVEPYVVQRILDFESRVLFEALPKTVCLECEEQQLKEAAEKATSQTSVLLTPDEIDSMVDESSLEESESQTENSLAASTETASDPDEYGLVDDPFALSLEAKIQLGMLDVTDYPLAPRVISKPVAFIIDSMLRDVIQRGSGYRAWKKFRRPDLGGKTGTTNGPLDAWFSGYHPELVASAWLGFDQNSPIGRREFGSTAALPIWNDFMELGLKDLPVTLRPQPTDVVSVLINPETGKRAKVGDPDAIFEIFRVDNVPEEDAEDSANPWQSEETINEELF